MMKRDECFKVLARHRTNEIVVAVAVTAGGRPLARVGGLQKHEIKGTDGLR